MTVAVGIINRIIRGWVNYFRVGNSSRAFNRVKFQVELKVRRFAAKKRQRSGFGWKRWSSAIVYGQWGLFADYHVVYAGAKARASHTET
jgi:RNA-directed DNA polymerase